MLQTKCPININMSLKEFHRYSKYDYLDDEKVFELTENYINYTFIIRQMVPTNQYKNTNNTNESY